MPNTHWNLACHSPSRSSKYPGTHTSPDSSRRLVASRCASSTAALDCVAASISFFRIAAVSLLHNLHEYKIVSLAEPDSVLTTVIMMAHLRDSLGSCSDSGTTSFV